MYIVTGGAGFIGSALVWKLNQQGITDILVVDDLGRGGKWKNLVNLRYSEYLHKATFLQLLEQGKLGPEVQAILHMGACSSTTETDAEYLMENNYRYTKILAQFCLRHDVRFIYASSAATYGDGVLGFDDDPEMMPRLKPLNMYGYSKQLFDLWALRNNLTDRMVGLKFFNVFGPNEYHKNDMMSVVCKAYRQILETGRLRLFKSHRPDYADGAQQRDFIYVKDCLDVVWWLLENREVNGIFNLGRGEAKSWNDLARAVFSAMEQPFNVEYIDMPEAIREKYQYYTEASMNRLYDLGCPVIFGSLETGVADYIHTYLMKEDPYLG
ncbi:ADP-glyceromanno-heptose 6-epimerase precursor [Desulfonatronum thiosulfatophilum]|uniref:ADP-L-glycero-D-manno-heptose-6-epimerase n=1 Tax=Desulfonatronum thiosulfatophilum TaxID=617002 RepID=A0A1G6B265_9BACT|nr:ADP-glyceromanno-heptose 6-epimerase [Desulfonatronum thiosulfatophilum]SDB14706.1 ADP-glyceromanno-heptose 6-epimerase precursor [Desulfonatronum thiosulfatophilum]